MECNQHKFKDTCISSVSCYQDSFNINNYCNSPITILCHESKACLLSYKICSLGCEKVLFIYGTILVKVIYTYGSDGKKYSQVFIKPFSKEIPLHNSIQKVLSVTANIVNKYSKRLCNDILLGFYNIQFNIKVKVPCESFCDTLNEKNLSDICNSNSLNLCEDPCSSFDNPQMPFPMQNPIEQKILNDIQNDCFNSINSTPYNTRL
ncbi:MAG: hypothetical protein ACRC28_00480 [Clostridium sp.]|uniref:hypothetical protein n=1 Tax=Clostridium sp. TaxID=1506 RepID=UPI003F3B1FFF